MEARQSEKSEKSERKKSGEKKLPKKFLQKLFLVCLVWTMASRCFWLTFKVLMNFPNRFCPRDKIVVLTLSLCLGKTSTLSD